MRVEQLAPFPFAAVQREAAKYPNVRPVSLHYPYLPRS